MPWTEADVPDQTGTTWLITGANSGIGFEAARCLAGKGATVRLACRSPQRAQQAVDRLRALHPEASLHVDRLDLGDLSSVRQLADDLGDVQLTGLINNAGIMAIPRTETADGFEMQLGVNHLGHHLLTSLLLDRIADGGRIVSVSSNAHKIGRMNFDDLMHQNSYERWSVYGQSKLANLLFCFELQRRLEAAGRSQISVACHPGYAATNLVYRGPEADGRPWLVPIFTLGNALFAQDSKWGAAPTLFAATHPDVVGGDYIGPRGLGELRGYPTKVHARKKAHDPDDAKRLWQQSDQLTGATWSLPA